MGRENVPAASRVDVLVYSRAASYTASSNRRLVLGALALLSATAPNALRPPGVTPSAAKRSLALSANTELLGRWVGESQPNNTCARVTAPRR